ncbi:hypothetical protein ACSETY_34940, partial [Pseudomonas aeruginosa]
ANMKTCRPFLVVVMLAVSWAAAVPLQDTYNLQDIHSEEQLQAYLENNPSTVNELYPDLLREASQVLMVVDPYTLVEMLRKQEAAITLEKQGEEEDEEAQRVTQEDQKDEH